MEKAEFSLVKYQFVNVMLDLKDVSDGVNINLAPKGVYSKTERVFTLSVLFTAISDNNKPGKECMRILCEAEFKFNDEVDSIEKIPNYFYGNCIAILFPYIRAFISTVTLQANVNPLILPTMNLLSMKDILISKTTEK